MSYLDYSQKLDSLLYYVKNESGSTSNEICNKLSISRRTLVRMIENLRLQGKDIQYCRKRKHYYLKK